MVWAFFERTGRVPVTLFFPPRAGSQRPKVFLLHRVEFELFSRACSRSVTFLRLWNASQIFFFFFFFSDSATRSPSTYQTRKNARERPLTPIPHPAHPPSHTHTVCSSPLSSGNKRDRSKRREKGKHSIEIITSSAPPPICFPLLCFSHSFRPFVCPDQGSNAGPAHDSGFVVKRRPRHWEIRGSLPVDLG